MFTRLAAASGTRTWGRIFSVAHANAPRGTQLAIVGTRASCQPMPLLTIVAPAAWTAWASATTSSHDWPSGTRSRSESRYTRMKLGPTRSRVRATASIANRMRFSAEPPHPSVRRFVRGARNWLMR